jgi:anthranilate 1,2-dioxygenase large subunit
MEKYVSQTQTVKVNWPRNDFSRIPFWLYHDKDVYQLEQDRIFKGAAWSYVGLEAELPNPGDFRTTYVGESSVILQRTQDGLIHAMVNRCAHRGAKVRREIRGNASEHICIYHRWCYSDTGELTGVPFLRGIKGQGGMGKDFKTKDHGLQQLRVAIHAGVIFVTFSTQTEPLEDYLGPVFTSHLSRIFNRPVQVLGYQRQRIAGNWKLYLENQRDTYHGSLLHEFQSTFGTSRATQSGGVTMDSSQRHNLTYARAGTDNDEEFKTIQRK